MGAALAQSYPAKPIRIIVPYPAGGGTDLIARFIAQYVNEQFGQTAIIDNRPGAGGRIGTEMVARASADGYTLGIATPGPTTIAATLYPSLPYRPTEAFAPISLVAEQPVVLLTHPSLPVHSVSELVALARSRPGQLTAAVTTATVPHLITELFKATAGIRLLSVPYKGGVEARTDIAAGRVEIMWSVLATALPFLHPPKLNVLALASPRRSALIPEVPTVREAGFPGIEGTVWVGIVAPRGTSKESVARLHSVVTTALALVQTKQMFANLAMDSVGSRPEEFSRLLHDETVRWAKIIRVSNIMAED